METKMAPVKRDIFTKGKENFSRRLGYSVELCKSIPERLRCPFCQRLMRDPVQTSRGELACALCYDDAKSVDGMCPIDGELIEPHEVFRDKAKGMEIRSLQCFCTYHEYGCPWKGSVSDVENHAKRCSFVPAKCYLCNEDIKPYELSTHMQSCEKWLADKHCLYNGCSYKPADFGDLEDHLRKEVIAHVMIHNSSTAKMKKEFQAQIEEAMKHAPKKDTEMETKFEEMRKQMTMLMTYATDMQNKYDDKTRKLEAKIDQLEKERIEQLKQIKSDALAGPTNVKVMNDTLNALQRNIAELDLRQQLFENTSHDGKLLWKITNVSDRMQKAITGSVTALHSAPVFTSKYGYKFCARLYLNGDGIGRGTHASLFFVLMKSEYDDLQQWPFNQKISFRLINQAEPTSDITESFIADKKSSSFAKPKNEMNIASGCPLFIKKENLFKNGFIKDDTMYIEVSVC